MRFFEQVMARTGNAPGLPPASSGEAGNLARRARCGDGAPPVLSTTN